jgi:hypothetical protein
LRYPNSKFGKLAIAMSRVLVLALLAGCAARPGPTLTVTVPAILLPTPSPAASHMPAASHTSAPAATHTPAAHAIKTVFLIVLENKNWSAIQNSPSAPYIVHTLLPQASYALQYYNPPNNHPSEPNYIWLEAGSNLGIRNDLPPSINHQRTTQHLVTLLDQAGISWKAYEEGISGSDCPLNGTLVYAPKHNPMVYFDDVTDNNNPHSAYCIAHERPYSELAADLQKNTVARYNFITPDLCHDMHGALSCPTFDLIKSGDDWLSREVPKILDSRAYKDGGALFIVWDEATKDDGPIGMIVLSPYARGGGYTNTIHYTHSSTLRTIQEIFGVTPFLGDAADATDLRDLFRVFP